MKIRTTLAALALTAAGITGCSNDGGGKAAGGKVTDGKAGGSQPSCDSLVGKSGWAKVADDTGCRIGDELQATASLDCPDGTRLVYFGEKPFYWGVSNGPLHKLASQAASSDDPAYKAAYQSCNA